MFDVHLLVNSLWETSQDKVSFSIRPAVFLAGGGAEHEVIYSVHLRSFYKSMNPY
jgi:hypothetical protein